jgi:hypothetical protein
MSRDAPPDRTSERSGRPRAYLDRRTKDMIAVTFQKLKQSQATIEAAKQLLETVRARRLCLPESEDAEGGSAATGRDWGDARSDHAAG